MQGNSALGVYLLVVVLVYFRPLLCIIVSEHSCCFIKQACLLQYESAGCRMVQRSRPWCWFSWWIHAVHIWLAAKCIGFYLCISMGFGMWVHRFKRPFYWNNDCRAILKSQIHLYLTIENPNSPWDRKALPWVSAEPQCFFCYWFPMQPWPNHSLSSGSSISHVVNVGCGLSGLQASFQVSHEQVSIPGALLWGNAWDFERKFYYTGVFLCS